MHAHACLSPPSLPPLQGVPVKEELVEFKVTPDALMPVGTHIGASHFVAGQNVDVTGWTKWKGFQGEGG